MVCSAGAPSISLEVTTPTTRFHSSTTGKRLWPELSISSRISCAVWELLRVETWPREGRMSSTSIIFFLMRRS
ncbi:hypothetical protein D3C76_1525190 [compost metagenome]